MELAAYGKKRTEFVWELRKTGFCEGVLSRALGELSLFISVTMPPIKVP